MEGNESLIFRVFNELLTPLMLVEVLSLTLFAIITVHSDFDGIPSKSDSDNVQNTFVTYDF